MKKLLALTALCAIALSSNVQAAWSSANGYNAQIKQAPKYKKAYRKKAASEEQSHNPHKSKYLSGNGDMREEYMTSKYEQKSNGNPHNSHKAMNNDKDANNDESWSGMEEEEEEEMEIEEE